MLSDVPANMDARAIRQRTPLTERPPLAVAVRNLSKRYQTYRPAQDKLRDALRLRGPSASSEFWALREIAFHVRVGESLGILGVNGAGKSTLLQIICGTLAPTVGSVETRGRVAALLELGSGFNPDFTGEENVRMNAAVLGLSKEEIDERFDSIAEFADIGDFIRRPIKTYSTGMSMRLAFAVAANVDADVLVIDEALAVGDALFRQKCMRYLRRYRKSGTLLIVSHDMNAIRGLCERAILLERGRLKADGSAKDVCARYIESLFENVQEISRVQEKTESIEEDAPPEQNAFDQRSRFADHLKLERDVAVVPVSDEEASAGDAGAIITHVLLIETDSGNILRAVKCGEQATVAIQARAERNLENPLAAFVVRDRLGQRLFADNTSLTYSNRAPGILSGRSFEARFSFRMPLLPPGDYSISAAVGELGPGGRADVQWSHDAVFFRSHARSARPNETGLVGLTLIETEIEFS